MHNMIQIQTVYVMLGIPVFVTLDIIPLNAKFVIRNHPKRYTLLVYLLVAIIIELHDLLITFEIRITHYPWNVYG